MVVDSHDLWFDRINLCFVTYKDYVRIHPENNYFRERQMTIFTAVIEKCSETGLYIGFVPGFPGAHSQGETLDELNKNLKEVIEMLLEDGPPKMEGEFIGTQNVMVA